MKLDKFLHSHRLGLSLGFIDIKRRYFRSKIGPFWLTLAMSINIIIMGFIFSTLFKMDLAKFLPFLAIGMIIWAFISTTIAESCNSLIEAREILLQTNVHKPSFILRCYYRNASIFMHNAVIIPIVLSVFGTFPLHNSHKMVFGFLLISLNLNWIIFCLSMLNLRYRDVAQIVGSCLQVAFFVSPIIWLPELMREKGRAFILDFNPFYHMIEVLRAPMLDQSVELTSYVLLVSSAIFGNLIAWFILQKYKSRIGYWL